MPRLPAGHASLLPSPVVTPALKRSAPTPLLAACTALQNPVGVAVGATAGHALATALAVAGGALAGKYVSEKTVNLVSGILFLLFAAATVYTML